MTEVIKSVYEDQKDIIKSILTLNNIERFCADVTYGNGVFYKELPEPSLCYDIDPQLDHVIKASSTELPLPDNMLKSIMFDPPFLTYVKAARNGNGNMVMSKRFSGYWTYKELEDHYKDTIRECSRVLIKDGLLVVKCQDIIHNHKMHATHVNVINWATEYGFRLKDLFILTAKHRMPSPNRGGKQKHARVFHSYFLVLIKTP